MDKALVEGNVLLLSIKSNLIDMKLATPLAEAKLIDANQQLKTFLAYDPKDDVNLLDAKIVVLKTE